MIVIEIDEKEINNEINTVFNSDEENIDEKPELEPLKSNSKFWWEIIFLESIDKSDTVKDHLTSYSSKSFLEWIGGTSESENE